MAKWIAEFDLEDGDTMPEHMELEYKGAKIDFHCRPLGTNALPSAQQAQKSGRWIPWEGDDCYECSACRALLSFHDGTPEENGVHFCPACGADMRDREEGG